MSDTLDSNLSVAGDASQSLSLRKKINLTLIALGVIAIAWGIYDEKTDFSYYINFPTCRQFVRRGSL